MADVFEFLDYRAFLQAQVANFSSVRGYQASLAKAAGCKRSFLSQVLHSHVHLTPDHGAGLCHFWNLDENETDWFMEILGLARSSSPEMRRLCQRRLEALKRRRSDLTERLKPRRVLKKELQSQYYSSWHWAAVHILVCIPAFNTIPKIANRLQLHERFVFEILNSLESMGLVRNISGSWRAIETDIHLPKTSSLNIMNHSVWRQLAISRIQISGDEGLHYTAIHSLSIKDFEKVRDCLTSAIRETREIVKPSPNEELVCITCDAFKV